MCLNIMGTAPEVNRRSNNVNNVVEKRVTSQCVHHQGAAGMPRRSTKPPRSEPRKTPAEKPVVEKPVARDIVAESSMESFPASDPPSWSGVRIGPPRSREDDTERTSSG